jgi:hypothetical protein
MSIIKFELKNDHIKLLKQLKWSNALDKQMIVSVDDINEPLLFGENSVYEAIDLILNGKPIDFDPFNTSDIPQYSKEQTEAWDILLSELPTALDIILYNGNFELGLYKTKYGDRTWKKINTHSN